MRLKFCTYIASKGIKISRYLDTETVGIEYCEWGRETAMLLLFFCLSLCAIANGEYSVRCSSSENSDGLSFVEARDGVLGRYRLEWCTALRQALPAAQWVLSLRYNTNRKPEDCRQYKTECSRWEVHSNFIEDVNLNLNCTNVCLSTNLDLIFNGTCYGFKTHLLIRPNSIEVQRFGARDYVYYVRNNYTKESFSYSQAVYKIYQSGDHVETYWSLHQVPVTNYTMYLCPERTKECEDVSGNCSAGGAGAGATGVRCALWPPPEPYALRLTHRAPWASGVTLFDRIITVELPANKSVYIVPGGVTAAAAGGGWQPWGALGGGLALLLLGGAALLACRSHLLRKLRERVLADWRARRQSESAGKAEGCAGGRLLLLYARDCAAMMEVAAALRALLLTSVEHVDDLYAPETVRAMARAPGEWVRRALARADTRVLLLQSPAAAALHAPALAGGGSGPPTLERPLLGRRAAHRAPHASDALLPLALRLLADGAHAPHAYRKYYVATIAGLEAELVGSVTPLRRYVLPAAAPLLLRDLAPPTATPPAHPAPAAPPAALQRLAAAVHALREHVRHNPDYLEDELIFFDYD